MQQPETIHYPLAFSTLACPDWTWEQIVQKAVEYGYQGIELRSVEGEMDLTKAAPFMGSRLAATNEWEKRWHPEIEEPEVALPVFVQVLRAAEAQTDML